MSGNGFEAGLLISRTTASVHKACSYNHSAATNPGKVIFTDFINSASVLAPNKGGTFFSSLESACKITYCGAVTPNSQQMVIFPFQQSVAISDNGFLLKEDNYQHLFIHPFSTLLIPLRVVGS